MTYKVFFINHETGSRHEFIVSRAETTLQAAERAVQRVFGQSAKFDAQSVRQRSSLYGGNIWKGEALSSGVPVARFIEIEVIPMIREKSHTKKNYHSELFTGEIYLGDHKKNTLANEKVNGDGHNIQPTSLTSSAAPSVDGKNSPENKEPVQEIDVSDASTVHVSQTKQTKKTKIISPELVRPVESASPLKKEVLKNEKNKAPHRTKKIVESEQAKENLVLPKIKMRVELTEHKRTNEESKKEELSSEYTDALTAANDIVIKSFGKKAKFIPYITDDRPDKKVIFQGAVIRDYSVLSMNVTVVVTNEDETFEGKLPIQGEPSFLLKNFLLNARAPSWANNKIQRNVSHGSNQQPEAGKNTPKNLEEKNPAGNDSPPLASPSHDMKKNMVLSNTEEQLLSYMKSKKMTTNTIDEDDLQRTEKGNARYNVVIRDIDNDLVFSTNTIQEDERSAIDRAVEKHFGKNAYFIQNKNLQLWRGTIYKKDKIIAKNVIIKVEPVSAAAVIS